MFNVIEKFLMGWGVFISFHHSYQYVEQYSYAFTLQRSEIKATNEELGVSV